MSNPKIREYQNPKISSLAAMTCYMDSMSSDISEARRDRLHYAATQLSERAMHQDRKCVLVYDVLGLLLLSWRDTKVATQTLRFSMSLASRSPLANKLLVNSLVDFKDFDEDIRKLVREFVRDTDGTDLAHILKAKYLIVTEEKYLDAWTELKLVPEEKRSGAWQKVMRLIKNRPGLNSDPDVDII